MFGTFLFISGQEIIFALLIALLLFGSKEIPRLARTFGKGMKEFKRATDDIKREIETSSPEVVDDFKEIKKNLSSLGCCVPVAVACAGTADESADE